MQQNAMRVAAAKGDAHVVKAHADRIATDKALVQDLDPRAFDEAHLQQAALKFRGGETASGGAGPNFGDHAGKATLAICQRHHIGGNN